MTHLPFAACSNTCVSAVNALFKNHYFELALTHVTETRVKLFNGKDQRESTQLWSTSVSETKWIKVSYSQICFFFAYHYYSNVTRSSIQGNQRIWELIWGWKNLEVGNTSSWICEYKTFQLLDFTSTYKSVLSWWKIIKIEMNDPDLCL